MATTIIINDQEYIVEQGSNRGWYYRYPIQQRFGKKVKIKDGNIIIWNGSDGSPSEDIGLPALNWGTGADYP